MKSIRAKITWLTVCAIIVTAVLSTVVGVIAIRNIGNTSSRQMLVSLCEAGEKNLNTYFDSVEQSVEMVSAYVRADLRDMEALDDNQMEQHIERVRDIFSQMAFKTSGILTYYYRLDPAVSDVCKGFWYINTDGNNYVEHAVTDITQYDTADTSALVWFTVPKTTGAPVWLPPYITENLGARVISYNVPVYRGNTFIGVVGIEIDYSTMAAEVDHIKLYDNGYAFINDSAGEIIYHPHIDVTTEETPRVPEGLLGSGEVVRYTFEGVEKLGVWRPLHNGMRLNVTVPVREINAVGRRVIFELLGLGLILIVVFSVLTSRLAGRITKPLRALTKAAKQVDEGDYDFKLEYDGDDEVGSLTRTFRQVTGHLKTYIGKLNDLAYADALTGVHNKGAYDVYMKALQEQLEGPAEDRPAFALCSFDCNGLKQINDAYGHEEGDVFLKTGCRLICKVFHHSPVFRVGGDEFAALLQDEDYENQSILVAEFEEEAAKINDAAKNPWDRVDMAVGVAVYDPAEDGSVDDVARRADKLMYRNKYEKKSAKAMAED
jgi:diguanylate cyclase (GGDEF)-like protein